MARALRAWAINQGGKNSVRNLRYGPRTRLVRGIYRVHFIQSKWYFQLTSSRLQLGKKQRIVQFWPYLTNVTNHD